jgi:GNAT superfamily N-acetyltransferase
MAGLVSVWQSIGRLRLQKLSPYLRSFLWDTKHDFELRCDLTRELPPIRPAKIPIEMRPTDPREFKGFKDELAKSDGADYRKVLIRAWYCRAGVETLYVGFDGDQPAYAQWLATPEDQRRIPRVLPGRFPELNPDELLVEGAYTFAEYRRLGLMRDGMAQLLRFALETGASAAITYVGVDNIPSLRGCADVGFVPHRMRVSTRRILRWTRNRPVGEEHWRLWEAATAKVSQPAQDSVSPLASPEA